MHRDPSGRSTDVDISGLFLGLKDVGKYNMGNKDRRKVYKTTTPSVALHAISRIFPCPSSTLVIYSLQTHNAGHEYFKLCFERALEKVTVDLLLASFAHATRYGIRYSRQGDPRVTFSSGYGVLTPITRENFSS